MRGQGPRRLLQSGPNYVRRLSTPAPSTTRLLSAAYTRRPDGSGAADGGPRWKAMMPLAVATTAMAYLHSGLAESSAAGEGEACGDSGGRPPPRRLYYVHEAKQILQKRLANFRQQRFLSFKASREAPYPKIVVSKEIGGPYSLEVPLPLFCDYIKVIGASVGALAKEGRPIQVHTVQNDCEATLLSFVLDKGGSLLLSRPSAGTTKLILYRDEGFTDCDLDAVVQSYIDAWSTVAGSALDLFESLTKGEMGGGGIPGPSRVQVRGGSSGTAQHDDVAARLLKLGAVMYDGKNSSAMDKLGWDSLAGYEDVKAQVEDTIIQALKHPDVYEKIAKNTRHRFESNRPRAVLFEGPPGTGKTLTARIISSQADIPLVYVPVDRIASKWYGESEGKLSQIFEICNSMGGTLIFIDEVDALATSRDSGTMHEATRRILSVILQNIEGFKQGNRNVLVCATNRKQDLDAALISRFDTCIRFDLPTAKTRVEVYRRYAKHLSEHHLSVLSETSSGLSCRDIKEVCENTERRWASQLIRDLSEQHGQVEPDEATLPPLTEYLASARDRIRMLHPPGSPATSGQQHHSV